MEPKLRGALKDSFSNFSVFFRIFPDLLADLGGIRQTGGKYRPRSTFRSGKFAENFFEKICLVPLLLRFWVFDNSGIF